MNVIIEESWKDVLKEEFNKDYFIKLTSFLKNKYLNKEKIFPKAKDIFRAFNLCPLNQVKVVLIGQDPYINEGQANGLCFSVHSGIKLPPSLINIYKEIENDTGEILKKTGDLTYLAKQGVLLLNSVLTVEEGCPASHKDIGWEIFTDKVINILSSKKNLVYILWGAYAQNKASIINKNENLILKSVHPSPLSASRGFFNNHHFTLTNKYLIEHGKEQINWNDNISIL